MIGQTKVRDLDLKNTMAPNKSGIYFFHDAQGEIVYIGKAKSLRDRISHYLLDYFYFYEYLLAGKGKSEAYFFSEMRRLIVKRLEKIKYVSFDCSEDNSKDYEKELIRKHNPKYNCVFVKDLTQYSKEVCLVTEELKTHFCYNEEKELQKVLDIL